MLTFNIMCEARTTPPKPRAREASRMPSNMSILSNMVPSSFCKCTLRGTAVTTVQSDVLSTGRSKGEDVKEMCRPK